MTWIAPILGIKPKTKDRNANRHRAGYARAYYRKGGEPTSQVWRVETALSHVEALFGGLPAHEFGPRSLRLVRDRMLAHPARGRVGYCRRLTNQFVGCIVRAWRWAAGEELVPGHCWHALRAVEGLRAGRTSARESIPVLPVLPADVEAVLPHLGRIVADKRHDDRGPTVLSNKAELFALIRPGHVHHVERRHPLARLQAGFDFVREGCGRQRGNPNEE